MAAEIRGVAFSGEGFRIFAWGATSSFVLSAADVSVLARLTDDKGLQGTAFSPDGRYVLSGRDVGTAGGCGLRLWDAATGKDLGRFAADSGPVEGMAFSPDSTRALAGCNKDNTLRLFDVATGKELASFGGHGGAIHGVCFSEDGKRVASACEDGFARVFRIPADVGGGTPAPAARSPGSLFDPP